MYACAVGIRLVSALRQTPLLLTCWTMHAKFSLPLSTIPVGYLCDRCIGPVFSYMSITDFTKLFWSSDTYFAKQDSTYISSLDFSILQSLVHTLEFGIVLKLSIL